MTTTQNADDLLIISDEVKSEDNDFLFFDTPSEVKEEILEEKAKEDSSFDFFTSEVKEDIKLETELTKIAIEEDKIEEIFNLESEKEEIFAEEVSEKISSVVGDLNSILDETISKLELRKTNLFALKDNKSTNIDDLNRQIAELKAKVKELEGEVKELETEDEQILTNITALQSMKLGETVNINTTKKTVKKVA